MKTTIYTSTLLASLLWFAACSEPSSTMKVEKKAVKYVNNPVIQAKGMKQIKGLVSGIKPALMQTFKTDKTGISGMKMCSTSAKHMGKSYNATLPKDSKVRRTALKYRNPNNKPDAIDVVVMHKLIADKNLKKPLVVDMGKSFRVYKALPAHKPCLACHGDKKSMPTRMKQILHTKYPSDLATGFKEGEFRGVIVSEIQKTK